MPDQDPTLRADAPEDSLDIRLGSSQKPDVDGTSDARRAALKGQDLPDFLYQRGMAHYQRREWRAALEYFTRLQEIQPDRQGLAPLLDEVRWFIQLELLEQEEVPERRPIAEPAPPAARPRWLFRVLVLFLVAAVTVIGVAWSQGRLGSWTGGGRQAQLQELYNRGQSRLALGDYEGAREAFAQLVELAPDDPEAQAGLARAERLQALAERYRKATAAILAEDWDAAAAHLSAILAVDPNYADAAQQAAFVARRQELDRLYTEGVRLYDLGDWAGALARFEQIEQQDPGFRRDAVQEFLFVCYLNDGWALISQPGAGSEATRRAIERFGSALRIHPRNVQAAEARRLSSIYLEAQLAFERGDLVDARARLESLLAEKPDYASGRAMELLFTTLVKMGEQALARGDPEGAREVYEAALSLNVADRGPAEEGLKAVELAIATPTPTPTPTPVAVVRVQVLNVRAGPGTEFDVISQVRLDDVLQVVARTPVGDWLLICCVNDQQEGWVSSRLVGLNVPVATVPEALVLPPTPTPTPTSTPAATPTPPPPPPKERERPRKPTPTPTPLR
ncbi:MAG: tetratricopeptide repeat protein [Chloroflexi bacterium]|nr:tetratricopeptide repeat protein [Chloroflexota bacterium]